MITYLIRFKRMVEMSTMSKETAKTHMLSGLDEPTRLAALSLLSTRTRPEDPYAVTFDTLLDRCSF